MKLKTLKEIGGLYDYNIEMIQAEAVKWVKDIEIDHSKLVGKKRTERGAEVLSGYCATMEWIKCFFNITEEDLK